MNNYFCESIFVSLTVHFLRANRSSIECWMKCIAQHSTTYIKWGLTEYDSFSRLNTLNGICVWAFNYLPQLFFLCSVWCVVWLVVRCSFGRQYVFVYFMWNRIRWSCFFLLFFRLSEHRKCKEIYGTMKHSIQWISLDNILIQCIAARSNIRSHTPVRSSNFKNDKKMPFAVLILSLRQLYKMKK